MNTTTKPEWGVHAPNPIQNFAIKQSNKNPKSLFGTSCRKLLLNGFNDPLDVEFWGVRFRLYPGDNLCEKRALLSRVNFDVQERQILLERLHEDFRFIDVGANVGLYSLFVAANAGKQARVLAIEPQPIIKQRLKFNLAVNPNCNITHVDCAVADKKGMAKMSISTSNRGASGFSLRSGDKPDEIFEVQTFSLVEILSTHDMLGADAMKIDIEGAEDQVLPVFFETTNKADLPKLLIIERNPDWNVDCIELAKSCGYKQVLQAHMNIVLELV
ncbi:MAG: FkbM family methyltransferase [Robiginitomaculum sp.]|nr:FkbM family methyltransferase [Robiginitomaculum sp.]